MNEKKLYQDGRFIGLDVLKAIALFAVILYHAGVQTYGYLGVDIFLVINGYVVLHSLFKRSESGEKVTYFKFICQKIAAFWPLILLAGVVCLAVGYFTMLPDDYENVAESVVATNLFANNILMAITTKDYWAIINDYKPLMHTWYISVLVQSYFLLPIVPLSTARCTNQKRVCGLIYGILAGISFALFSFSLMPAAQTFYFFPCRFFEIALGAVIACFEDELRRVLQSGKARILMGIEILTTVGMLTILLAEKLPISNNVRLTVICLLAVIFVAASVAQERDGKQICSLLLPLARVGQATFSYYIWHQVILAFIRYTIKSDFTVADILLYLACVILAGELSNRLIEKPMLSVSKKHLFKTVAVCGCVCIVSCAASLLVYENAGVVRDVPELDIDRSDVHRSMHAAYNGRASAYDIDFDDAQSKPKVLVIGDSFGRDFVNILLEAGFEEKAQLSYIDLDYPEAKFTHFDRIGQADYVFMAFAEKYFTKLPEYMVRYYDDGKVYIVGNKAFGDCMGTVYNRRNRADYYETATKIDKIFLDQNETLRENFGNHLIDMITPVQNADGTIRAFTDENKFISQDGKHLTQSGARYYAKLLDLSWLS